MSVAAVLVTCSAGLVAGGGAGAFGALDGAGAGEFAAAAGDAFAFALGAGDAFGDAAAFGEAAAFGCAAFVAGDADGTGLSASAGARFPMFERSGPNLILPSSTGRSKR
jgi:hypothetical protein